MANKRTIGDKQDSSSKKKQKTAKRNNQSGVKQVEDEEDFPRGGASALSPLEVRRIKQEAEKDVLFGTTTEEDTKKKKKAKAKKPRFDEEKSPIESESTPQIKLVENLSFKRLSVGMKLLGAVKEITEYEVVISLPNGLSGFVNVLDINDKITELLTSQDENMNEDDDKDNDDDIPSLDDLFTVNSLVVCVIKEIFPEKHGHKKIQLSVKPEDINNGIVNLFKGMVVNGYVSSEEDHGYIVSFGIQGKTGFLPKKPKPPVDIIVGKPLQVFVKSGDEARVAAVRVDNEKIKMAMMTEEMKFKLSSLVPGMMVQMTVKECTSNGLVVSFLDMFEGTVSLNHLPENGGDGQDLEKKYKKKSKIIGRILYINTKQKIVVLSAHQAIVEYKPLLFGDLTFGHIIEEATVLRVDQGFGMLLKIDDDTHGYSHISHVSDSHLEKLDKRYKSGTQHKCRVVGFNAVDGLVSLSLKKSVLEKPFLRYHDIEVGSLIECTILSLEKFGMLVSVAHNIKGLVTNMHLADIILKHPEKKLKEGKKIECRVLTVIPEKRRLHLTYKKTLVSSEHPIITKYSDVKVGMVTHGFITSLREHSCIVTFYNNVTGLVPRGELGIQPQEDPRQVFYAGQVVKCYVMNCKPEERKIKLTFKASSITSPASSFQGSIQPATILDVDVVASTNEGLDVQVSPGGLPALLPVSHLSDHPCNCKPLLAAYKPSSQPVRLTDVLYFGCGNNKTHIVSFKPSLKSAVKQGKKLTSFDDIHVGMMLSGYIKQIMPYGVFIEFAPRIFGLAPNSFLANQFVADASEHFEVGQSVIAKVVEIHEERKRFLVSLKQSDLLPDSLTWDQNIAGDLVQDYLRERKLILDSIASNSDNAKALQSYSQGSCIEAKVKSIKKHGIMLQLAGGFKGFVPHQLAEGVSCQEGEVVYGVVLDHDIDAMTVEVTLLPDIVQEIRKEKTEKTKRKKMKPGQVVDCVALLIKQSYIIVCLPQHHYRLAIAPARMHLNDIRDASKRYAVRQKYTGTVHSDQPLVVVLEDKSTSKENIKPGIITSAVVKSVKAIQMNVQLENCGLSGRVNICHVTDEIKEGKSPFKDYHQGEKIQVKILGFRDTKTHNFLPVTHKNFTRSVAELSIKQSDLSSTETQYKPPELEDYKAGDKVTAFVKSVTDHCIWMIVSDKVTGRVSLLHSSLDVKVLKKLSSHFKQGTAYRCYVMDIDTTHETLELSIAYKPEDTLSKGSIVTGRVSKVNPVTGLNIQLPLHKCGRASLTDILDQYTNSPVENFKERQIVKCYVLGARDDGHLDLSLRPSRTKGETTKDESVEDNKILDPEYESLTDLDVGGLVKGFVQSVGNAGVFVSLSRHIRARVQIKNLSHFFVKDWRPLFPPGKLVTGKVLSIDPSNGHIELTLKGKDTGLEDPAPNPKKVEKAKKRKREAASKELKTVNADKDDDEEEEGEDSDEEVMLKKLKGESDSEDDESEIESDESSDKASSEEEADEAPSDIKSRNLARLQVSSGFDWNATTQENGQVDETDDESTDSETEATEQVARKKSKRQKRAEKKAEEEFLYKTEQALLDQERAPESTDDFDRLVLTSPNNSVLWLQYMAFHLHITEIDKARAVAERAVKTISFREEREKLNIWVAMMNLENLYGTQDSLVKIFERALQHNDPKKVFFHLITIYSKSDKNELAEQLFHTMTKRFSQSKKVWIEFGRFYMKSGKVESARKILQRALKSLPARKHVDAIVQFALMEFKLGDPQRGQTVMEEVLSNYPKRSDLWSVYIDMMIKQGDPDVVRNIFERVIHLNLSSKKMKFLFKRYLLFEREYGDELSVEKVKTKAMEYVESKVALS